MILEPSRTQGPALVQSASTVAPPRANETDRPSLLPSPASGGLDGVEDAISIMYKLVAEQGQSSMSAGEVGVDAQNRAEVATNQQEEAAIKQQQADEAKASSGFWSDLESIAPEIAEYVGIAAAAVGAAAVTVASCGTGGIAVAAIVVALSASGMLVSKTGCLGKDSAYIGLGLDVAAVVVSFGASAASLTNGALATADAVATGASGAADVVAGAATIVTGNRQADILDDTADVQQAVQAMNRNARLTADLVEGLKASQESNKNALRILAGASATYNQTLSLASAAKA